MVSWSLKFAFTGAIIFIALVFALRLGPLIMARTTGSVSIDSTRPMWFVFYLGMWVASFSIAYSIFSPFPRK